MSINWQVEIFDNLSSTMDAAQERAVNGATEGAVVVARSQNSARGRRDNKWAAPIGNLYFSFILRPDGMARNVGQYSFVFIVALADVIKKYMKPNWTYKNKWPNDGLLNDRKFSGILLETSIAPNGGVEYLNTGIGVNIKSAPDETKTYLQEMTGSDIDPDKFLNEFLNSIAENVKVYRDLGFSPIRNKWLMDAKGLGEDITVRLPKDTLKGIFIGLDDDGALILKTDDGEKLIHAGDVFFGKEI